MPNDVVILFRFNAFTRDESNIITVERTSQLTAGLPHPPLGAIAPNRISQFLSSYKSNTTITVVLPLDTCNYEAHFRRVNAFSLFEKARYLRTRLDRFHDLEYSC